MAPPSPVPPAVPADPPAAARSEPADAAALLASMAEVRIRVDRHAADLNEAAKRSADWTSYVRSAPLACAAGAAAVGYLVVPARPRSPKVVRVKGKPGKRGADAPPTAAVERPVSGRGPWMGVMAMVGNVAVRAGTAYLSQKAGSMFGGAVAHAERESSEPPETSSPGADRSRADRPFGGPR